jgi:hypothetical protein
VARPLSPTHYFHSFTPLRFAGGAFLFEAMTWTAFFKESGEWKWFGEALANGIEPTVLDDMPEGPPRYWPGARCPHGRWELPSVTTFAEAKAKAQEFSLALMEAPTCVQCRQER